MPRRRLWPLVVLGAMMALYIGYFAWFTLRAHDLFQTRAFDLGIYDQVVWNTAHGRWFRSTIEEGWDILLADHFQPILLPIALTYWLLESPKTLLLLQTVALALGALPVYWLARDGLKSAFSAGPHGGQTNSRPACTASRWLALAFAAAYLIYLPLHSANIDEFHPSALAAPLLLFALYFMRHRRVVPFLVCAMLAMATKEIIALTTLFLGLYVILFRQERRLGLALVVVSALWFVLSVLVIIPYFNEQGQSPYLAPAAVGNTAGSFTSFYSSWGSSPGEVIVRLITRPDLVWQRLSDPTSLNYLNALLRPLAYTPLLGLPILLPAVPLLLINLLSDYELQQRVSSFFHYAVPLVPFFIVAAIDGTGFVTRRVGRLAFIRSRADARPAIGGAVSAVVLLASLLTQWQHGFLPFSRDFYLTPHSQRVAAAQTIVDQVPAQGTVSASPSLVPHLSQRESIYLYPNLHGADHLVVDVTYGDGPFPPRDRFKTIQGLLDADEYGVQDGRDGFLWLQRGLNQNEIPEAFYSFARPALATPQIELDVSFGDELRLVGFDLIQERPVTPRARLVLYWQALRPIDRDLRIFLIRTDPWGELRAGTEIEFVEPVWYPPQRWTPGEIIRTETPAWSLEFVERFGLAVGAVEGPGFWELDRRLRPSVDSGPWQLPLIHDDGLLWLVTLNSDGQSVTMEGP